MNYLKRLSNFCALIDFFGMDGFTEVNEIAFDAALVAMQTLHERSAKTMPERRIFYSTQKMRSMSFYFPDKNGNWTCLFGYEISSTQKDGKVVEPVRYFLSKKFAENVLRKTLGLFDDDNRKVLHENF